MAKVDVENYVQYITGNIIPNGNAALENQTVNIHQQANYYTKYKSDIDIEFNYKTDCYVVTINSDTCALYLHKAMFYDKEYNFSFNVDKLEFTHNGTKIYISK